MLIVVVGFVEFLYHRLLFLLKSCVLFFRVREKIAISKITPAWLSNSHCGGFFGYVHTIPNL